MNKIEKFKLLLALHNYRIDFDVSLLSGKKFGKIVDIDYNAVYNAHISNNLLKPGGAYYRYFSYGKSENDIAQKLMEQWYDDPIRQLAKS